MNHPLSLPAQRPLLERWAHDVAKLIVGSWRQRRARRELEQRIDAMAELSAAVLRDIGWPDDLASRAAARREAHARHIDDMPMLGGYRGGETRAW